MSFRVQWKATGGLFSLGPQKQPLKAEIFGLMNAALN